jgi:CheY-like chemotaxis protein
MWSWFVMSLIENDLTESEKIPPMKILVADDDMLNRRMMQLLLVHEGHLVDVVSNGLEAFDAVKFQNFDMVLMDLHMPVMDGIEASNRIREWENGKQRTFIVALTGSYLPEEGQQLFEAGIDNYIPKPFEMKHLQRMLKYRAKAILASSNSKKTSL